MKTATPTIAMKNVLAYRKSLGMNQTEFWRLFGVTQSGGSRYEKAREMPDPVAMLVLLYSLNFISQDSLEMVANLIERPQSATDNEVGFQSC